jgi:ribosomal protein S12 methylthiotransferase
MSKLLRVLEDSPSDSGSSAPHYQLHAPEDGVPTPAHYAGNAAVVTLGCAKNLVDSEVMLGVLQAAGYQIVNGLEEADVAVVNTCSFLQSAVRESLDSILQAADYKKTGRLRKLVVAGCLVGRYGEELDGSMPEVDAFISGDQLLDVGKALQGELGKVLRDGARPYFLYDETTPRIRSTAHHTAYVKISEGCNRPCTFCIIPQIRGKLRSRSVESVVAEVQELWADGVREFNLVGQDLTDFGSDRVGDSNDISDLLMALNESLPSGWIRLLYAYPLGITEKFLRTVADCERVCNYIDVPLQHASESVLKKMKRPLGKFSPRRLVQFIRDNAPEVRLRTTFIVGFPGETEADIQELEQFVREGWFSSVGVFTYSQEDGTGAAELSGHVDEAEKEHRRSRVLAAQQEFLEEEASIHIGKTYQVLVEGSHDDTDFLLVGRNAFQAPEVDGTVIINDVAQNISDVQPGRFYDVQITEVQAYDMIGTIVAE